MDDTAFPLERYLARLGLDAAPGADEAGLRAIHEGQARAIPFENFDIHLGRPLLLTPGALVTKLVDDRRGGYCFEQNGLLELALRAAGFELRSALGRVLYNRPVAGPRTHQVLVVTMGGRDWLADTGFGGPGLLRWPLPLEDGFTEQQADDHFRIVRDQHWGWVLQRETGEDGGGDWLSLYGFADEVTLPDDIAQANFFCESAPASLFRQRRIASILTPRGRTMLADMELSVRVDGVTQTRTLAPGAAYMAALAEHFGLRLNAAYDDFMKPPC